MLWPAASCPADAGCLLRRRSRAAARTETRFATWPSSGATQLFMRDLERLDRDGVAGRVERRAGPLRGPRVGEIPADLFRARFVEQHHGAVAPLRLAVDGGQAPLPQLIGVGDAALQRNRRERVQARK